MPSGRGKGIAYGLRPAYQPPASYWIMYRRSNAGKPVRRKRQNVTRKGFNMEREDEYMKSVWESCRNLLVLWNAQGLLQNRHAPNAVDLFLHTIEQDTQGEQSVYEALSAVEDVLLLKHNLKSLVPIDTFLDFAADHRGRWITILCTGEGHFLQLTATSGEPAAIVKPNKWNLN